MNYEITTKRLVLRPLVYEDVPTMFGVLSKYPEMTKYMSFSPPTDVSESYASFERFQKKFPKKEVSWSIFLGNVYMGRISLMTIVRESGPLRFDSSELGYWLSPEYHSKGYMTEAVRGVLQFGFTSMDLHKIGGGCLAGNIGSQRVLEKVDFRFVGLEKEHIKRDGVWYDHRKYEMLESEWRYIESM